MAKKTTTKKKAAKKPAKKSEAVSVKKSAAKKRITNPEVRRLGFRCETLTDAAAKCSGDLIARLKKSKKLRAQWDRGRFLRKVSLLAAKAATMAETADQVEMSPAQFEELMATDIEVADIWQAAQMDTLLDIKGGIVESAKAGKAPAIKSVERIFLTEHAAPINDFASVTIKQMCVLCNITRPTLDDWVKYKGLSRSSENTFDLRVFIKWFEGFSQRKVNVSPKVTPEDELRDLKAIEKRIVIDERRGVLLSRDEVIAWRIGFLQRFCQATERRGPDVAGLCENQPKRIIEELLGDFFSEIRKELCEVPEELKLEEDTTKELAGFFEKIK